MKSCKYYSWFKKKPSFNGLNCMHTQSIRFVWYIYKMDSSSKNFCFSISWFLECLPIFFMIFSFAAGYLLEKKPLLNGLRDVDVIFAPFISTENLRKFFSLGYVTQSSAADQALWKYIFPFITLSEQLQEEGYQEPSPMILRELFINFWPISDQ